MYLKEIVNIIGNYNIDDKKINHIVTDSRLVNNDDIFICINDGYKYIKDAIKRGACLIICEVESRYKDIPIIKVDSTIQILGKIAQYIRNKFNGIVIAITGSNGKTTTKELLSYVLSSKYKVLKNNCSENNHIGVPNTLLKLDNSYDYLVIELGTNHPGEIKYLTDIVKPNICIITNIGSAHIGNFGSIENIFKEKISIKNDDSILFVNGEDKYLKNVNGIKVYLDDYKYKAIINHLQIDYNIVIKVCEYLNMKYEDIINRINSFKLNNSRMNITNINGIELIDDSYNASYESVVAGLNSLKDNRKIIILGDMLELGDYSYYYHSKINDLFNKMNNYYLITIGNYTKILNSNKHFYSLKDLKEYITSFKFYKGDTIYIKGAHKNNLYEIVLAINKILQNK